MARKRLKPANAAFLSNPSEGVPKSGAGFDTLSGPPIARVAGESAAENALRELADDVSRARAEGRMVLEIPLGDIAPDHLARDRVVNDAQDMQALIQSIEAHGQRTPIEVTKRDGDQAYGLISGWRRLAALEALFRKTGDARFGTVLALLREPKDAGDAYVAMVEENEVRVGLSYYERARVAAEATKRGVFESEKRALLTLFATASRPKRSRIRSFIVLYHALDEVLKFPAAIPERLGLSLVEGLKADPEAAGRYSRVLRRANAQSATEEAEVLSGLVLPPAPNAASSATAAPASAPQRPASNVPRAEQPPKMDQDKAGLKAGSKPSAPKATQAVVDLQDGLQMRLLGDKIEVTGTGVSQVVFDRIKQALGRQG